MIKNASKPTAIIIGGGLAGLASAVELTTAGFAVTVVEKNAHMGGKMNVLQEQGFKFDMGPTILTMPDVVRGIIQRRVGACRIICNWCAWIRSGDVSTRTERKLICFQMWRP